MINCVKTLYGKTSIDSSDLDELKDWNKIELEYYQLQSSTSSRPYGIEVVKKQIENDKVNIENKEIKNICDKQRDTKMLLNLLVSNKVTPISVEDIVQDFIKVKAI